MKSFTCYKMFLSSVLMCLFAQSAFAQELPQHSGVLDTAKIEELTGAKGKLDSAENVFRVTVPQLTLPG